MKKFLVFITFVITWFIFSFAQVQAKDNYETNDIYDRQYKLLEIDKLNENLSSDTVNSINNIGIKSANWEEIPNINIGDIFKEIFKTFSKKALIPFSSLTSILAIIMLSTIINNLKTSFGNKNISSIMSSVSILCLCASIIHPMVNCINSCSAAIKSASGFILCETPIMATIMVLSGHPITATSSQVTIMAAGQIISYFAGNFLVPYMNILLGAALISSISPRINLNGLCSGIYTTSKSVFKFLASIFTGILTIQNLVTSSADNLKTEAAKFTLDTCVPIVGGALSDAFGTVQGCLKLLKSGAGAFGIIAIGAIFLPIVAECSVWIIFLNLSKGISDIFELKKISFLFKSVSGVMSVMMAALVFVMTIMVVSTVLLMIIGR